MHFLKENLSSNILNMTDRTAGLIFDRMPDSLWQILSGATRNILGSNKDGKSDFIERRKLRADSRDETILRLASSIEGKSSAKSLVSVQRVAEFIAIDAKRRSILSVEPISASGGELDSAIVTTQVIGVVEGYGGLDRRQAMGLAHSPPVQEAIQRELALPAY